MQIQTLLRVAAGSAALALPLSAQGSFTVLGPGLSPTGVSADGSVVVGVPGKVVYGNGLYAGVRFYDRGISEALVDWAFVTHGGFPLRDLAFLPLD